MDFIQIKERIIKNTIEIYPDFKCGIRSKDLMTRGRSFYAIWNPETKLWSTDEYVLFGLIEKEVKAYGSKKYPDNNEIRYLTFNSFDSGIPIKYKKFLTTCPDNFKQLDNKVVFANSNTEKLDYISHKLSYDLQEGSIKNYDELMQVLYLPEERTKIEWSIGSIISGDSLYIQKFLVFYGEAGSGKSTVLNIIEKLFEDYCSIFDAKALVGNNNNFATESFRTNPLVAIQHDGDLSKIEDNSKLNSIISHELITINEKYKQTYTSKMNCFLFMGTNRPVKITDSKSGIIRRLIDVRPSGNKVPADQYHNIMNKINYELSAIAYHCLQVYKKFGKNYYNGYIPQDMMLQTNIFYNFVQDNYFLFKEQDGTTLTQAYLLYKEYCNESSVGYITPKHIFREELKSFFDRHIDMTRFEGRQTREVYKGFKTEKFQDAVLTPLRDSRLNLRFNKSNLDEMYKLAPAQYGNENEVPIMKWDNVKTTLGDINSKELHYIKLPSNHIVIDFDLKNETGQKCRELNLIAAAKWPDTYAEFSKSGQGVHLHYIYDGDVSKLARLVEPDIEIKVFTGNASLRRKLTLCNNEPINTISNGLPIKEEKMITETQIKSEYGLRKLIERNLNKEIHSGTKPSIDFIDKILTDAYNGDLVYDLSDMRNKVLQFAMNSTNQSEYCVKLVNQMKFISKQVNESVDIAEGEIVFFDVEVFKNLFIVVYKVQGENKKAVKMINPTAIDIESLFKFKLIGFNCRRYDNHILYARYLGYSNEQLYQLSQKIINDHGGLFGEAYNLSYTDVYDFSSEKQSLKKWEIELGIHHKELEFKWDQPVPEDKWDEVADYCINDVIATEKTFKAREADWTARQILADLAEGSVNDTTNQLATKFIFGNEKHPNLVYTDLATIFPGYELVIEKGVDGKNKIVNKYRDIDVGMGGYVYAEHGIYYNVALLDVASMHPTSLILMNYFGDYTPKFKDILDARLMIKHGDYDSASKVMNGRLEPYLKDKSQADKLAYALKIVLNSQYGLTSSKFDLPQRDVRNVNNIVALRGALFMKTLQDTVTDMGYKVVHIKTDSIKIAEADQKIIDFCIEFAKKYGYTFEHEATFEKMCLITDADYVGKYSWAEKSKNIGKWTATGAQFAHPFVFKTLFSAEQSEFKDYCETRSVKTALYLDMNENLAEGEHDYKFVGRVGEFCPIQKGKGGGELVSERGDKYNAVAGTKGYRWLESELVKNTDRLHEVDDSYFLAKLNDILNKISQYGEPSKFCERINN